MQTLRNTRLVLADDRGRERGCGGPYVRLPQIAQRPAHVGVSLFRPIDLIERNLQLPQAAAEIVRWGFIECGRQHIPRRRPGCGVLIVVHIRLLIELFDRRDDSRGLFGVLLVKIGLAETPQEEDVARRELARHFELARRIDRLTGGVV